MKSSTILLLGSLLANGALVAGLLVFPPSGGPAAISGPAKHSSGPAAATAKPAPTSSPLTPVANAWTRLRTDNLDELKRRLQAAGFPPREARAILAMAITEQTNERREAIQGKDADVPYWKNRSAMSQDPARQTEINETYREMRELNYKYIDGPDALVDNEDAQIAAKRRFGDLPLGKLQQLTALQHDLDDQRNQTYAQNRDLAAIRSTAEAVRALEQAHLAEISKLLTPAELEQYELRSSNNAGSLRNSLANFRPNEEEFKALYAMQKNFAPGVTSQDQWVAQAQAILGPDRYAEYMATMSSDGRGKLGQLIARLNLPMTTITTVNAVRDDISARSKVVQSDPSLSTADRSAALAALAQEAQQKLTSSLGDRGYRAYVEAKGDWLRPLKPKGQ